MQSLSLSHIICGTGRCGTVYMSRLFTSLGIPCGHEAVFTYEGWNAAVNRLHGRDDPDHSAVSVADGWSTPDLNNIEAESSYMAAPFLGRDLISNCRVLHVVRHPVRVINSFCNFLNYFERDRPSNNFNFKWEKFIYYHAPRLAEGLTQHERGALYYIEWNKMIERNTPPERYHRVRIEDGNDIVTSYLKVAASNHAYNNKKCNGHEIIGKRFQLIQLNDSDVRSELIDMGNRYGYNMSLENIII